MDPTASDFSCDLGDDYYGMNVLTFLFDATGCCGESVSVCFDSTTQSSTPQIEIEDSQSEAYVAVSMGIAGETIDTFDQTKQDALVTGVEQVMADQGIEADVQIISIGGVPVGNSGRRLLQDVLDIELQITLASTASATVTVNDVAAVVAQDDFATTLSASIEATSGIQMGISDASASVFEPQSPGGANGCSSIMSSVAVSLGASFIVSILS